MPITLQYITEFLFSFMHSKSTNSALHGEHEFLDDIGKFVLIISCTCRGRAFQAVGPAWESVFSELEAPMTACGTCVAS
jgi:hypothetical protein